MIGPISGSCCFKRSSSDSGLIRSSVRARASVRSSTIEVTGAKYRLRLQVQFVLTSAILHDTSRSATGWLATLPQHTELMSGYCDAAPGHEFHGPYHDNEYGFPLRSDRELFERLILEINQAGLSWLTILRKREGFREAYSGFDIDAVAAYGD